MRKNPKVFGNNWGKQLSRKKAIVARTWAAIRRKLLIPSNRPGLLLLLTVLELNTLTGVRIPPSRHSILLSSVR